MNEVDGILTEDRAVLGVRSQPALSASPRHVGQEAEINNSIPPIAFILVDN
jgi:hypothetical protein